MLRLSGITDLTDLTHNRLLIRCVDPVDPSGPSVSLGELSSDAHFAFALPGFGPSRVGVLLAPDGFGGLQSDLIFWNDEVPDSLQRVTESDG
jgi:hypothetical protein